MDLGVLCPPNPLPEKLFNCASPNQYKFCWPSRYLLNQQVLDSKREQTAEALFGALSSSHVQARC